MTAFQPCDHPGHPCPRIHQAVPADEVERVTGLNIVGASIGLLVGAGGLAAIVFILEQVVSR